MSKDKIFRALFNAALLMILCIKSEKSFAELYKSFPSSSNNCAIIVGGSVGAQFDSQNVSKFWNALNTEITTRVYDGLLIKSYSVFKLIVDDTVNMRSALVLLLAQHKCQYAIQIGHFVEPDNNGNKTFKFTINGLYFKPIGQTITEMETKVESIYSKDYVYLLNKDTMDHFVIGRFSDSVVDNIINSGTIEHLKKR